MMITDGTGAGNVAKVTRDNRVAVDIGSGIPEAARAGNAYTATMNTAAQPTVTVTTSGEYVFHMRNANGSGKNVIIEEVAISTDTANTEIHLISGHSGDPGASTAVKPVNMNRGFSNKVSSAHTTTWVWADASSGGLSGLTASGSVLGSYRLAAGTTTIEAGGRMILPQNETMTIFADSPSSTVEVAVRVTFYEELV
jgi:hypothetical protein